MRAPDEPIDVQRLHDALPEGVWLDEAEAVAILGPTVDSPEPFRETDARTALWSLVQFGLLLQDGRRYFRPAPDGRTVPGRLSILHRRRVTESEVTK